MDDNEDGLMLNFAAPSAQPQKKSNRVRAQEKKNNQRVAKQQTKANIPQPSPPSQTKTNSLSQDRTKSLVSTPSLSSVNRPVPSTSTSTSTPSSSFASRSATATSTPSSAAARVPPNGFISALFPSHGNLEPSSLASAAVANKQSHDPTNAPSSEDDFASLGLDPLLVYHLANKIKIGTHPTMIQKLALPHLLSPQLSRDVFIQAQTGSGKTLTYLLPILQSLMPLCQESFIDRSVGTLAIILAPTRELARQIYQVLEKMLSLSLSLPTEMQDENQPIRRTRWLVPGLLSGGSTKNHEKQRLRKGCPIVVSTPGRLLDHLQNTSSFDIGKCRWLILDEADRLLEMGFEEQLTGIIRALDGRRKIACAATRQAMAGFDPDVQPNTRGWIQDEQVSDSMGMQWWAQKRRVVLCSATLDENVQMLAGNTLHNPLILHGGKDSASQPNSDGISKVDQKFAAPAQLDQNFVVTPPKLRLVTLVSLLRSYLSGAKRLRENASHSEGGSARVIVFMSCTDSVDFHWKAFGGVKMTGGQDSAVVDDKDEQESNSLTDPVSQFSELLPQVPIFKLHGSMSQAERIASLGAFSKSSAIQGSVLLCTSVASRGLDLPDVGCVIQMDPPTEGGVEEYLHRVGRTARVGRHGESWLVVLPQEVGWVQETLERNMEISDGMNGSDNNSNNNKGAKITQASIEKTLQQGFGGVNGTLEYQSRATEVQLSFERWVLESSNALDLARRGFLSHVRAYATHPTEEKRWFNVKALHLGHLAKAFALREPPKTLGSKSAKLAATPKTTKPIQETNKKRARTTDDGTDDDSDDDDDDQEGEYDEDAHAAKKNKKDSFQLDKATLMKLTQTATGKASKKLRGKELIDANNKKPGQLNDVEARMYAKVRELGKMSKRNGVFAAHSTDEFQIM